MNLRVLRRLTPRSIITLMLALNVICVLYLSLYGVLNLYRVTQKHTQKDFNAPLSYYNRNIASSTAQHMHTYSSQLAKSTIEQIKRELNDSTPNNDVLFPADIIGRYLFLDPNLCKNIGHIDIIIIVHTAPGNLDRRQRIRSSFANATLFYPFEVRVAFLFGKSSNITLERILWLEHITYNDTVMGDFTDHYHNLSIKGVMGYRWVSEYCPNSELVLKIDDDVLVNMFKLLSSFSIDMLGKTKSIFCNIWFKGTMPILRKGKWKVESHIFYSRITFPYDYCSGFMVVMTTDLMRPMYEAAKTTPFFWIDDIYLFGMLPLVIGGVTYYNYALDKNITLNEQTAINCTLSQGPRCPIFATHISDHAYMYYWDIINRIYTFHN